MLEQQERELTPYEISDISYDLSVRDGILGLDQVKDVLRNSQPSHYSTHTSTYAPFVLCHTLVWTGGNT